MEHFKIDKKRRTYNRSEHLMAKVYISEDSIRWHEVKVENLSASGAKFSIKSIKMLEEQVIYMKIEVISAYSEFTFKTESKIVRKEDEITYAVKFINMKKTDQVMIDEIIHSNDYRR